MKIDVSDQFPEPSDALSFFEAWLNQAKADLGRVTIAVVGKAGVGKSTLINAVFGEGLAATGIGRPLTKVISEYRSPHVTLLDAPGLELGTDIAAAVSELEQLQESRTREGTDESIHAVWFCINSEISKIEDAEVHAVERLARVAPTVVVLTRVLASDDADHFALRAACEQAFTSADAVVDVLAFARTVAGVTIQPFGLEELVGATVPVLPEGARRAFVVLQCQALDAKLIEARAIAARRANEVLVMPASEDAVESGALSRQQIRMLAEISAIFDLHVSRGTLMALARLGTEGLGAARGLIGTLAKWLEGAGVPYTDVLGGLADRELARRTTLALGQGYAQVCRDVAGRGDAQLDERALLDALRTRVIDALRRMRGEGETP